MKQSITITSKGQATIPAVYRRKLGLPATGGKLDIRFDEKKGELVIAKPLDIKDLSKKLTSYISPGAKPVIDTDDYYQRYRESTAR